MSSNLQDPFIILPCAYTWNLDEDTYARAYSYRSGGKRQEPQQQQQSKSLPPPPVFGPEVQYQQQQQQQPSSSDTRIRFQPRLEYSPKAFSNPKTYHYRLYLLAAILEGVAEVRIHAKCVFANGSSAALSDYSTKCSPNTEIRLWSLEATATPPEEVYESQLKRIRFELVCFLPYVRLQPELRALNSDFNRLRRSGRFADVTLVVGGRELPAHKAILSLRSPVFDVMLSSRGFLEGEKGHRVVIEDMSPEVATGLLEFIYTGTVLDRLDSMAMELLIAGHKYGIQSLVQTCADRMCAQITDANALRLLSVADLYELAGLKRRTIDYINRHARRLTASVEWKEIVLPNPRIMAELYQDFVNKHPGSS